MLRPIGKIFSLTFLLVLAMGGIAYYQYASSTSRQIEKLQDEKRQLEQVVERLSSENRVADVLVSRQARNAQNILETNLLFVEYDKKGNPLPGKSFTVLGDHIHFDALVIKFEHDFVAKNDPLRGHSIALFTTIYGDKQSPADAQLIDSPGKIPDIYRSADPKISAFEMSLWTDFWKLYEDEAYRQKMGVRSLGGHGVWGPFQPDRLYSLSIEADGGLNMTSQPIKGIYREALKARATTEPLAN